MLTEHLPRDCYSQRELIPKGIVIHYISAKYTRPDAPFDRNAIREILEKERLSYHYYITQMGEGYEWTPPDHQAWHAGKSMMNGKPSCNKYTFGIALAGAAHLSFPRRQIIACGKLCAQLMSQYGIRPEWIKGHDQVRKAWNEANPTDQAARKDDPGELFPWDDLYAMIKGVTPHEL